MIQGTRKTLRRAGGLVGVVGTLAMAGALITPQPVAAAGNPSFEGILSAPAPTGFMTSPNAYDVSGGAVTVNFIVVAKNLTGDAQTVALHFSADHILTDNGENIADGQPGQPGIAFSGPSGTTQSQMAGTQSFTQTWAANGTQTLSLTYTFDTCGYFQLDVWAPWKQGENGRGRATLASGFIRVLGCTTALSPTATPTPVAGSSSPSPDGGVLGITTPSTGSGGAWFEFGVGLAIAGACVVVIGARRPRADL